MSRSATHQAMTARLSSLTNDELAEIIRLAAPHSPAGIGGRSAVVDIAGTKVFLKRVPLTDLELRPEHMHSTANLFNLPPHHHYGIGSPGSGAWRELAARTITTHWASTGDCPDFPLLHHWRVLPDTPPTGLADEFGGIDGAVAHWEGSAAVRARLEAMGNATSSLVLFLEHLPRTLAAHLREHPDYTWAEAAPARTSNFLSAHGFVHFDAHFENILTDGTRIYFTDFGLTLSKSFALRQLEQDFLRSHLSYDRSHTVAHLLHNATADLRGNRSLARFLTDWQTGHRPANVPPATAHLIDRNAATALISNTFWNRLTDRKTTPFPTAEIDRALTAIA